MKTVVMLAAVLLGLFSSSQAHMEMKSPPPLRSKFNRFTTDQDYDMTSPLSSGGADFPCKGSLKLLGTSQGQAVAEWTAGQPNSMTITGNTPHSGGSCQASLSFDSGSTWKVIHSYVGECPVMGDSSYQFTLPSDTPAGQALFAWSWFNKVGNREMYMNCAVITIKAAGNSVLGNSSRPNMFVANVGNGCGTTEGLDLKFPNPGPDVDMKSDRTTPPVGQCSN
ncbi:uncharacterized protein HRG_02340 [Hirsutella rhossiliensis]|uniref:Extracellular protein n=1 Tax=Hirsutella rhossiliensis TaxID=111463 RepID=A0A9P8SLG4_9HYPO|nr:uncharacterized protein HRG_02340 [Hirsutella rhossiliensis]KAH0966931.1 hypothetical protein HRG_02340 [Hirsutella rhossiliensis]